MARRPTAGRLIVEALEQNGVERIFCVPGESYVAVLDGKSFKEKARIKVPNGPGMQIFSPDGKYGYVCSSFSPETVVVSVATHKIVGRVKQASPFCPNIAVTPDGTPLITAGTPAKLTMHASRQTGQEPGRVGAVRRGAERAGGSLRWGMG